MLLQVHRTDAPRGFRLVGELDASNVSDLAGVLGPEVEKGGDLVLDLSLLAFLDSAGVHELIKAARGLDGKGRLLLVAPSEPVRHILRLTRLESLPNLEIVESGP